MMIEDFFIKFITKELSSECNIIVSSSKVIEHIKISETLSAVIIQVNLIYNIIELMTSIGICIQYWLKTDNNIIPNSVIQKNGLIVLMQNARQNKIHLPIFPQSSRSNCKQNLRNDLVD